MGFGLILILLGVIGVPELVNEKFPAAKQYVDKLCVYNNIVGAVGLVSGLLWAFDWIISLRYLLHAPLHMLLGLAGVLLSLALGLIFGLDFLLKDQKQPPTPFFTKLMALRPKLIPFQKQMSLTAMGLGTLYFLIVLF